MRWQLECSPTNNVNIFLCLNIIWLCNYLVCVQCHPLKQWWILAAHSDTICCSTPVRAESEACMFFLCVGFRRVPTQEKPCIQGSTVALNCFDFIFFMDGEWLKWKRKRKETKSSKQHKSFQNYKRKRDWMLNLRYPLKSTENMKKNKQNKLDIDVNMRKWPNWRLDAFQSFFYT